MSIAFAVRLAGPSTVDGDAVAHDAKDRVRGLARALDLEVSVDVHYETGEETVAVSTESGFRRAPRVVQRRAGVFGGVEGVVHAAIGILQRHPDLLATPAVVEHIARNTGITDRDHVRAVVRGVFQQRVPLGAIDWKGAAPVDERIEAARSAGSTTQIRVWMDRELAMSLFQARFDDGGIILDWPNVERYGPQIRELRRELFADWGLRIPAITFYVDTTLPERSLNVQINALRGAPMRCARRDEVLIKGAGEGLPAVWPANDTPARLLGTTEAQAAMSDGAEALAGFHHLLEIVSAEIRSRAGQLIDRRSVGFELHCLSHTAPELVREALRRYGDTTIAQVLRRLVEDGLSIRPLQAILEAMLCHDPVVADTGSRVVLDPRTVVPSEGVSEVESLILSARRAVGAHTALLRSDPQAFRAHLLDPSVVGVSPEDWCVPGTSAHEVWAGLDDFDRSINILTTQAVALRTSRALRSHFTDLVVLHYGELPTWTPIVVEGRFGAQQAQTSRPSVG